MVRTRWPPGPVNPGLLPRPGRSDRQRRWVPETWGPAGQVDLKTARAASADSEVRPGPRLPTLRPCQPKTTEAGPEALSTSSLPTRRDGWADRRSRWWSVCVRRCRRAAERMEPLMALAVRLTTQNQVSRGQRPAVDHASARSLPSRGPVERLSAEDQQHGHDERPHHIQAPPTADLGLRTGSAMLHARGRTANRPSSETVRQIVGVVAAVVRGHANDDGFSRLLLRADDGTRTARLVREVIFQVRAGFRDRVQQMIAHGSPPQDRRLQYEPVAGSTGQPIPRERPAVAHLRAPGRAAGSRQNVPSARHPSLRHIAQCRADRRLLARRMSAPPPPSVTASREVVGSDCGPPR